MTNPAKPAAALLTESLPRKIRSIHKAATSGIASSKDQTLTPEASPKRNNILCFGFGTDWIDTKSIVSTGMDRKYQE